MKFHKFLNTDNQEIVTDSELFEYKFLESELLENLTDETFFSDKKDEFYLANIYSTLFGGIPDYGEMFTKFTVAEASDYLIQKGFKLLWEMEGGFIPDGVYTDRNFRKLVILEKDEMLLTVIFGRNPNFKFHYNRKNEAHKKLIQEIADACSEKDEQKENQISLILQGSAGNLYLQDFSVAPMDIDFDNYNDGFKEDYEYLVDFVNNDKSGLVILNGPPGGGKTSILNTLLGQSKKKFVYFSSEHIAALGSPGFLTFALEELKGSVLFLEDAEAVLLQSGDQPRTPATVQLLGITDGFISRLLSGSGEGLKVFATLNMANLENNIDPALLRKNRLRKKIEFKELTVEKANNLLAKLGKEAKVTQPTMLTDIFGWDEETNVKPKVKQKMGF